MKPILIRTFSGGIYTLLILVSIFMGAKFFGSLLLVFLFLSLMEFHRMLSFGDIKPDKVTFIFAGIFSYLIHLSYLLNYLEATYLYLILPVIFLMIIVELFRKTKNPFINISSTIFGLIYLVLPISLLNVLYSIGITDSNTSADLIFGFFIIIWTNDTFAYLSGMIFGRHKFFERISPKKTWEGTIGGLIFGIIGAYVLSIFFTQINTLEWIGFALVIIIFGTFGDLIESMLKRTFELKDSGSIMPGHGGILDRLDSILVAVPFALVYIVLVLN